MEMHYFWSVSSTGPRLIRITISSYLIYPYFRSMVHIINTCDSPMSELSVLKHCGASCSIPIDHVMSIHAPQIVRRLTECQHGTRKP